MASILPSPRLSRRRVHQNSGFRTFAHALACMTTFTLCASLASADNQQANDETPSVDFRHGDLKVSNNGRFLMHEDETPFFYLADTAWELFHRLDREQATRYLENRRAKGFTVIQAVALAELDGLTAPNPYGHRPLLKTNRQWDPTKPDVKPGRNDDYWDHVEWIIDKAAEAGLYIGLLPTWGDKVEKKWGAGPVVFDVDNARAYGEWIAKRYANKPNILWVAGGDRPAGKATIPIWNALGEGLRAGDPRHLITFHFKSSEWAHGRKWLDFNMLATGHGAVDGDTYSAITEDYALKPAKPCVDAEPRYEDHPVNWHNDGKTGWFDDYDVRQAAYWSVFAGGCGFAYGAHGVWQMYAPDRHPISKARTSWFDSLDFDGASDMTHLRRLIESRPMLARVPDQSLIVGDAREGAAHVQATRGRDYAFVYIPTGESVQIESGRLSGEQLKAWWFNPRDGTSKLICVFSNAERLDFDPPGEPSRGNDWVLVLDDAASDRHGQ